MLGDKLGFYWLIQLERAHRYDNAVNTIDSVYQLSFCRPSFHCGESDCCTSPSSLWSHVVPATDLWRRSDQPHDETAQRLWVISGKPRSGTHFCDTSELQRNLNVRTWNVLKFSWSNLRIKELHDEKKIILVYISIKSTVTVVFQNRYQNFSCFHNTCAQYDYDLSATSLSITYQMRNRDTFMKWTALVDTSAWYAVVIRCQKYRAGIIPWIGLNQRKR